jgi:hypothetical protein
VKRYGLTLVTGDNYGSELLAEQFRHQGIGYRKSDRTKSELYLEVLPMLNSSQVELLESQRLINQFAALERRVARGGKSSVDHPPGAHDDVANAVAGALVNTIPLGVAELVFDSIKMGEGPGPTSLWDTSPIPEGVTDAFRFRFSRHYRENI